MRKPAIFDFATDSFKIYKKINSAFSPPDKLIACGINLEQAQYIRYW
jgi:hypothetical protein